MKMCAWVVVVGVSAAVGLLAVPVLDAPGDTFPEVLASVCAGALLLAWTWFLLATARCLADELRAGGSPDRAAQHATVWLRPALARRLARALVGGGLTCLAVHPLHVAHAVAPEVLPLPVRPVGEAGREAVHDPARRLAGTASPDPARPHTVVVRPGDTLWSLAASALPPPASPTAIEAAWRRLYAANRSVVGPDPDLIHPGARLRMP